MKVLVLLSLVAGAFAFLDCPANQHYDSCGTACPLTCENYKNPPKVCVLMCVPGCHCDAGYVKAEDGSCVMPEKCPSQSQAVWDSSSDVCDLPSETGLCRAYFPRYYFNKATGQCETFLYGGCGGNGNNFQSVLECKNACQRSRASANCPANSQYKSCGTACPLTCDNYRNPPKACVLMCNPGCHCDKGYVKTKDGSCVQPENCPSQAVWDSSSDVCDLPSETGLCRAYFPRYYFNKGTGQCETFLYGGCGGNGNNFQSVLECKNACQRSRASANCPANSQYKSCGTACPLTCDNYRNPPKACVLMCNPGCHCDKGYVKTKDGSCVQPQNCPSQAALDRPDCDKAPETGVCRAYMPRYYYDQQAGMCKSFVYGGCGGNRNNFESEDECYNKCGALAANLQKTCDQPKEEGPCFAAFRRFYFNKESGQCEQFAYGGCLGNDNNFNSQEDCEAVCVH